MMINLSAKLSFTVLVIFIVSINMAQSFGFDTHFVEMDSSKMIMTGDSNYAICSNNFPHNWKSVSVNGDEVTVATRDNNMLVKRYHSLSSEEKNSLEKIKASLNNVIRMGPFNVRPQPGFAKLTTFDRNGGSSSMGTGGGSSSSSSSSSSSGGGTSISRTGPSSFIISKTDFPFKWQRVFINDDIVTVVYKDSKVLMLPQDLMRSDEKAKIVALRHEVDKSSKAAEKITNAMTNSLRSPMDFVNRALGGIFGR